MTSPILIQGLIRELAKKYNMNIKDMENLVNSPFNFTIDAMRNSKPFENPNIRIINFGSFIPSKKKLAYIKMYRKMREEENEVV